MTALPESPHPDLVKGNNLLYERGVWLPADQGRDLDYSDGSETEEKLRSILTTASDLSWRSSAFSKGFGDWALDYHLSPRRGNLLRGLKLKPNSRILEVGAGCGAISRYLGDHGHCVDALEGSLSRSRLAAMRCSGLESVAVVHGDFNVFNIPGATYDVVLFVGVLEYARRFGNDSLPPQAAVQAMLSKALASLKPDGMIVVAIENRVGGKYLFGGPEDHLTKPWVGLADYPVSGVSDGITTFDRKAWTSMIDGLGAYASFFYPLPDYKLPAATISTPGLSRPELNTLLWRYPSEHRAAPNQQLTPARLQSLALEDAGLFADIADSFGIVISPSAAVADDCHAFDWIIFEEVDPLGAGGWAMPSGEDRAQGFPSGQASSLPLSKAEPLGRFWLRSIAGLANLGAFSSMVVVHAGQWGASEKKEAYEDLFVNDQGALVAGTFPGRAMDRGYSLSKADADIAETQWMVDALGRFWEEASDDLRSLPDLRSCASKEDFILLLQRVGQSSAQASIEATTAAIYWATETAGFSEQRRMSAVFPREGAHQLIFEPSDALDGVIALRVDPCDHEPSTETDRLLIEGLDILGTGPNGRIDLLSATSRQAISGHQQVGIDFGAQGLRVKLLGTDPWFRVDLTQLDPRAFGALQRVEMTVRWIKDAS